MLNSKVEQELNDLAFLRNESIERIITDALSLYAEEQEDKVCLELIKAREHEPTISHDDVIAGLNVDSQSGDWERANIQRFHIRLITPKSGSVQHISAGGQALPDNQAKPDLQNALLLGFMCY